jgi:tetratricopeptide (TPR) repeat protein
MRFCLKEYLINLNKNDVKSHLTDHKGFPWRSNAFGLTIQAVRTRLNFLKHHVSNVNGTVEITGDFIMEKAKNAQEYIVRQRAALAKNPECGMSHYNLAVALLGLGKDEEAEASLHDAIEFSPTLAEAYVQLGGICLKRGDLEGCLQYNTMAVNTRAGFAEGYGNIGFVHMQQGNLDKAVPALEKAVRWNPKFIQAYATLANAYLAQGRIEKSIETNLKLLELDPQFAVAYNNLAIAYMEKGEFDLAIENADKALAMGYEVAPQIMAELQAHR